MQMLKQLKTLSAFVNCLGFVINVFAQEAEVAVALKPAGNFKAKTTEVKGAAVKNGDTYQAENVIVELGNLQTGIELRDKHTKKHLEVEKYPQAILLKATGKGGKGEGVVKIRDIEQKISGTFETEGNFLIAHFPLKLSDFKITGIKYMGVGVDDTVQLTVKVPVKAAEMAKPVAAEAKPTTPPAKPVTAPAKKK